MRGIGRVHAGMAEEEVAHVTERHDEHDCAAQDVDGLARGEVGWEAARGLDSLVTGKLVKGGPFSCGKACSGEEPERSPTRAAIPRPSPPTGRGGRLPEVGRPPGSRCNQFHCAEPIVYGWMDSAARQGGLHAGSRGRSRAAGARAGG